MEPQIDAPSARGNSAAATNLNATPAGHIRIGVVPAASAIRLGATGDWTLRDKGTGSTLLTGTAGQAADVTLASRLVVVLDVWRIQVGCVSQSAAEALVAPAAAAGYATAVVFNTATNNCWRALIGELPPSSTFSQRVAYENVLISEGLAPENGSAFGFRHTVTEGRTEFRVTRGTDVVISPNQVVIEAPGARVTINGVEYRGRGEAIANSVGSLAGVNELPVEEYLWGVVPRELGPVAYPEMEAQKAQAVAARTWALVGFNKRIADGYNLRATTDDQVYGGFAAEHPISTQAVNETAGVVATYQGRPISTYYSSTSGGYTASFEEWLDNAAPIPYLTGVPDAQHGAALDHVPSLEVFKRHANPTSLRNVDEGDFEADWSRYHRWTFEWTNEEISQVLSMTYGPVGKVLAINVLERGPSGRVLRIEYVTDNGTFTSTRNGIRSSLKYIGSNGTPANFLSTLFFIEPVTDPRTEAVVGYKAYGGGWGHGVGLSQTGAVGMAEKGATYEEILKHYYQGISLGRAY